MPAPLPTALRDLEGASATGDPAAFDTALRRVALARPTLADGTLPDESETYGKEAVLIVLARLESTLDAAPPPAPHAAPGGGTGTP
ncbi:hypothetical protein [Streptomyces sp. NPDC050121]|uniref:hypothetical protein n=1 Tax=Streptomyces sp. NPDC050121 TaxID=3365601 RepID=UPI0037978921